MAVLLTTGACIALVCWFENWLAYSSDWNCSVQIFAGPEDVGEPNHNDGGVNVADCNPN